VQIDKRAAQVNADYEERKAKLDQARQLRKEARRATHEASHTRNDPTAPVTMGAAESCPRKVAHHPASRGGPAESVGCPCLGHRRFDRVGGRTQT
jgi:hypothetical protein